MNWSNVSGLAMSYSMPALMAAPSEPLTVAVAALANVNPDPAPAVSQIVQASPTPAPLPSALAEKAMLADISFSIWGAAKTDKEATRVALESLGVGAGGGRFVKELLKPEATAEIRAVANRARRVRDSLTSPWRSDGARILAAVNYDAFMKAFRALAAEFQEAVARFVERYPDHIAAAEIWLNETLMHGAKRGVFNPADYPSQDEIGDLFKLEYEVFPLPLADDFRTRLTESDLERERARIKSKMESTIGAAVRDAYERIADVVGTMAAKLDKFNPDGKGAERGTFRDSLVGNVQALVAILPGLNLSDDPALTEIGNRMARLVEFDAETLRDSDAIRKSVQAEAAAIASAVSDYLA